MSNGSCKLYIEHTCHPMCDIITPILGSLLEAGFEYYNIWTWRHRLKFWFMCKCAHVTIQNNQSPFQQKEKMTNIILNFKIGLTPSEFEVCVSKDVKQQTTNFAIKSLALHFWRLSKNALLELLELQPTFFVNFNTSSLTFVLKEPSQCYLIVCCYR